MKLLSPLATSLAAASVATTIFASFPNNNDSMWFRQYQTATDIPDRAFREHRIIQGRVVKIIDGDTIRIRHYPFAPLAWRSRYDGLLSENTISVRLYAVDCPETAKFGNAAMPLADEATEWTKKLVDQKMVRVKLLSRDQYQRVVGKVSVRSNRFVPFLRTDVTLSLANKGYATLYTGGGAQYDDKKELIEKKIARAQRKKRGIWKNGETFETPAEYKRKVKERNNNRNAAPVLVGETARVY